MAQHTRKMAQFTRKMEQQKQIGGHVEQRIWEMVAGVQNFCESSGSVRVQFTGSVRLQFRFLKIRNVKIITLKI